MADEQPITTTPTQDPIAVDNAKTRNRLTVIIGGTFSVCVIALVLSLVIISVKKGEPIASGVITESLGPILEALKIAIGM
jgi:hypothetical protein